MASTLSTRLKHILLATIQNDLEGGTGKPNLSFFNADGVVLSVSEWQASPIRTIADGQMTFNIPAPAQALADSTAAYATLLNGKGEAVYQNIPLGTPTQNPNHPIQLNSLIFYKGGTVTILSFNIA